jgi:hypothetical protein
MPFSESMAQWAEKQIRARYQRQFGMVLPLDYPRSFREKLFVRMIRLHRQWHCTTLMSDKLAVRRYVRQCIGEAYLSRIAWVGAHPDQAPLEQYSYGGWIAKTNHGCGGHRLVVPGDQSALRKHLCQQLKQNYYWMALEAQYFHIPPKLYLEQLVQGLNQPPPLSYRLWCFGGCVELIQVDDSSLVNPFYDRCWAKVNLSYRHGAEPTSHWSAPVNLKQMLQVAETLAAPFGFVRVDLYNLGERLVFSELTFTPLAGDLWLTPSSWDHDLGALWPATAIT